MQPPTGRQTQSASHVIRARMRIPSRRSDRRPLHPASWLGEMPRKPRRILPDHLYEITLTASYDSDFDSDTVLVRIDNSLTATSTPRDPKTITFDDIRTVFDTPQDPLNSSEADIKACSGCHQPVGGQDGVPVYWVDDVDQPATGTTFYEEVLARIDFNDPVNSLLLTKPSNNHHFGGLREGFEVDNPANRQNYDLFLNWIMEGAPEK